MNVPIHVTHLFPVLDEKLIELLRSLTAEEWHLPTIAKRWQVRDIAAHLLDGNMRTLSTSRDSYFENANIEINSYGDLVNYLNTLNADWVKAFRRVSPQVLVELLTTTGKEFRQHMREADLCKPAIFPVSWAGETESFNWFHIAREYTEKWIHQQQIRHAVGKEGIMSRELFYPFIETLLQALPYTYRNVDAPMNTVVRVTVTSEVGGDWYLQKLEQGWKLLKETTETPAAEVFIDPQTAWKLFSKGITPVESKETIEVKGDPSLAETALTMISVMA